MTQKEVEILKKSFLDSLEAYVNTRLQYLDFVKTQIGVVTDSRLEADQKYYHTVVCNATSQTSGITYENVLSLDNTLYGVNSVVFLIAPNGQFSNQFILGGLDPLPSQTVNYSDLQGKPSINGVILLGNQTTADLIPLGQGLEINADGELEATGGSGTEDYEDLENKPTINNITLTGNKTTAQILPIDSTLTVNSDGELGVVTDNNIDLLYTGSTIATTINMNSNKSMYDYDCILIQSTVVNESGTFENTTYYVTSNTKFADGYNIGVADDTNYLWYTIGNNGSRLTLLSGIQLENTSSYQIYISAIYGMNVLGIGGGGGGGTSIGYGTTNPTGGNDGDVYFQNDGQNIINIWQKVNGSWISLKQSVSISNVDTLSLSPTLTISNYNI